MTIINDTTEYAYSSCTSLKDLIHYADLHTEFTELLDSKQGIDFQTIINAANKIDNIDYLEFTNLIAQMFGSNISVEEFFTLADDEIDNEMYKTLKNRVLNSHEVDLDDVQLASSSPGFAISKPEF